MKVSLILMGISIFKCNKPLELKGENNEKNIAFGWCNRHNNQFIHMEHIWRK